MTETTEMTPGPQRLQALARANEVRLARAGLKRAIAQGKVSAAEVILACPEAASSWTVGELLISQRRWGTTKCSKFLARNQIGELKQIGALTDRQRRVLAAGLMDCEPDALEVHHPEQKYEHQDPEPKYEHQDPASGHQHDTKRELVLVA